MKTALMMMVILSTRFALPGDSVELLRIEAARSFPTYEPIKFTAQAANRAFTPIFALGDLNRDQRLDAVILEGGGPDSPGFSFPGPFYPLIAVVLLQNADGSLLRHWATDQLPSLDQTSAFPRDAALEDLNDDGNLDFVLVAKGADLILMFGKEDGTFKPPKATGYNAVGFPSFADLNGDGHKDIVAATREGAAMVLLGKGDGTFVDGVVLDSVTNPHGERQGKTMIGDLNNDGKLDVAIASTLDTSSTWTGNLDVFLGKGDGTFLEPIRNQKVATYNGALSDFNGDGILDYAGNRYNPTALEIWLGQGDGHFRKQAGNYSLAGFWPTWVSVADLNGDGLVDIVVSNVTINESKPAPLSIFLGKGDGTFQPKKMFNPLGTGTVGWAPGLVDFNGDGLVDIITTTFVSTGLTNNFTLSLNKGAQLEPKLGFQLTVLRSTRSTSILESSSDLNLWTPLKTAIGSKSYSVIDTRRDSSIRFYRVRRE